MYVTGDSDETENRVVLLAVIAALGCGFWLYQRMYFPGRLIYTYHFATKAKSWTATEKLANDWRGEGGHQAQPGLRLSRDGEGYAFFERDSSTKSVSVFAGRTHPHLMGEGFTQSLDGAPVCHESNLEWSPDGSRIAYADSDTLYVFEMPNGKMTKMPLPLEPSYTLTDKLWREYIEKAGKTDSERCSYVRVNRDLSGRMKSEVESATARLQEALRIDPSTSISTPSWEDFLYPGFYRISPYDDKTPIFLHSGRRIRWVSKDTIYCDNWELKITRDEPGKMECSAKKSAFPSEFLCRPTINYQGDKAAYLVWPKTNERRSRSIRAIMVIVGSNGEVVKHLDVLASPDMDMPRWSLDGRYIALWHGIFPKDDQCTKFEFDIYEWQTGRHWALLYPDSGVCPYGTPKDSGWDWIGP